MSRHAATPTTVTTVAAVLRALTTRHGGRHAATPLTRTYVTPMFSLTALAVLLVLFAYSNDAEATTAPPVTAERAVVLTLVDPPLTQPVPAPTADTAPRVEEDEAAFDCKTMGNRACGEVRTDARFPGVSFHYVTTYDAAGQPAHTYTLRQFQAATGEALSVSTAADRY